MIGQLTRKPLGELLTQRTEFIRIDDTNSYKRCRVQLHAAGIVLRDAVSGAEIKTKQQQVCKTGDFLVAEIDAKVGGFGIVPNELNGAIVSSHYFLFEINEQRLNRKFLSFFIRTPEFFDQVKAQGSTNYAAIRPQDLLRYEIPLPQLEEQRRIVARIEELAAKIEGAKGLRREASEEVETMARSAFGDAFRNIDGGTEAYLGTLSERLQYGYTESAVIDKIGPKFLRITDIQNGQVDWSTVPYCLCPEPANYLLKRGDILIARTGGTTGKSFLIDDCPEAVFASYLIRVRPQKTVLPEYLYNFFQSPDYWYQVSRGKKGTGQPNVNGETLARVKVPVPTLEEQARIVARLDKMKSQTDALANLQQAASMELEALLPSVLDKAFKGEL